MEKKFYYLKQKIFLQEAKAAWNVQSNTKIQPKETEKQTDQHNQAKNLTVLSTKPSANLNTSTSKQPSEHNSRLALQNLAQNYRELVCNRECQLPQLAAVSGVRLAAGASQALTKYIEHSSARQDLQLQHKHSEEDVGFLQLFRQRMHYEQLGIPLTALELIYMGDYKRKGKKREQKLQQYVQRNCRHTDCSMHHPNQRMPAGWVASQAQNIANQSPIDGCQSRQYAEPQDHQNSQLAQDLPELNELVNDRKFSSPHGQPCRHNGHYYKPVRVVHQCGCRCRCRESNRNQQAVENCGHKSKSLDKESLFEAVERVLRTTHLDSDDETTSSEVSDCFSYRFQVHKPPPPPPPSPPPELKPDKPNRTPSPFPLCAHEDTKSCAMCEIWMKSKQKPLQLLCNDEPQEAQTAALSSDGMEEVYALRNTAKNLHLPVKHKSYQRLQAGSEVGLESSEEELEEENQQRAKYGSSDSLNRVWYLAGNLISKSETITKHFQPIDMWNVGYAGLPTLSKTDENIALRRVKLFAREFSRMNTEEREQKLLLRFQQLRQFQNLSIRNYFQQQQLIEQPKKRATNSSNLKYYACPMRRNECRRVHNKSLLAHFLAMHCNEPGLVLSEVEHDVHVLIMFQPHTFRRSQNICLSMLALAGPEYKAQSTLNVGLPSVYAHFSAHVPLFLMACRTRLKPDESQRMYLENQSKVTGGSSLNGQSSVKSTENVLALWMVSMELVQPVYVHMTVYNRRLDVSRSSMMQVRGLNKGQNVQKFISQSRNFLRITGQDLRVLTNNYTEPIYLEISLHHNVLPDS